METAITCERVGKCYRIYPGQRARMVEILTLGHLRRHEPFWALREVSFHVRRGEAMGVIGENGSGKSTLLRLLSGITRSTEGRVDVRGSLSALLELGAGFHPEFTGRENTAINEILAGLGGAERQARQQEAIAFADLGDFIDQPVRTYSTGMVMRLGFALATSVDSEILVLDEVLAVGDEHFQRKCLKRIADYRKTGKTILFCSHNLYQVKQVCDRAIWLKNGRIRAEGEAAAVVDDYIDYVRGQDRTGRAPSQEGQRGWASIERVELVDGQGKPRATFDTGESLCVRVWCGVEEGYGEPQIGVAIVRNDSTVCYGVSTGMDGVPPRPLGHGRFYVALTFPRLRLLSGQYALNVCALDEQGYTAFDIHEGVCPFAVRHSGSEIGLCRLEHLWEGEDGAA